MKNKITIINVAGARPNFMKIAPIVEEMNKEQESIVSILVHTGQHYDESMSKAFFEDLEIPRPDINLEVGSETHAEQTAFHLTGITKISIMVSRTHCSER